MYSLDQTNSVYSVLFEDLELELKLDLSIQNNNQEDDIQDDKQDVIQDDFQNDIKNQGFQWVSMDEFGGLPNKKYFKGRGFKGT